MNDPAAINFANFQLPLSVLSRRDVSHLAGELEQIDNEVTTARVRAKTGVNQVPQVTLSQPLIDFLMLNQFEIKTERARAELIKHLHILKENVPVMHLTFATTADQESIRELTAWLRSEIHPQSVIEVGLQPSLIAGVCVRTPNRVHDFSMRAVLQSGRAVIKKDLEALREAG